MFGSAGKASTATANSGTGSATALAGGSTPFSKPTKEYEVQPIQPASTSGGGNSFTAAYRKAKDAVTDALTIKPKVIPADDPIRLDSDPGKIDSELYRQTALMLEARGNAAAAVEQYRQAIEAEPKEPANYVALARLYDRQGQFDEATAQYRQAIQIDGSCGTAWNDLGLCLARQGKFAEATDAMRQAVQIAPDKPLYRNNMATVLVQAGATEEAFRQLIAVHDPATAHYNVAYLLYQQGQTEPAKQHLYQALQHNPALDAARQLLAVLDATGWTDQVAERVPYGESIRDALQSQPFSQPMGTPTGTSDPGATGASTGEPNVEPNVELGPAASYSPPYRGTSSSDPPLGNRELNPYARTNSTTTTGLIQPRVADRSSAIGSQWGDPPQAPPLPPNSGDTSPYVLRPSDTGDTSGNLSPRMLPAVR
ncbi:MAG: tetratricopeptide repeat protein [Planctomycetales bacterium]|nr:tetratricopeptide repeat protein [Planctomycetales bacterium]